ncbi:uncharacterized protein LOC134279665 [Saccostrea cucullata]|uniref:uncharacterized protein LOC134279665 n=1 Tax=Saccostrea cuccullata TaxID=36930 RepID=UPI002ED1F4CC
MINGGLGETHINNMLAALNIPNIIEKSLKDREREVGVHLEEMAEESCRKQLHEEIRESDGNLTVSFDGAWQKRGTGHANNSLTGHATLFGEKTQKCVSYAVKVKNCRICSGAKAKGVPPRKHRCQCNWSGSAKAMEPAMACEMIQGIINEGSRVLQYLSATAFLSPSFYF